MTLPASGAISCNAINVELGLSGTATISLNTAAVRTLLGVGASPAAVPMSAAYGKSNRKTITYSFAANTANASLNVTSGTAPTGGSVSGTYVAGSTDVIINVAAGVYLHSISANTAGLTLTGGTTGDKITLNNSGYIMGLGGNGGGSNGSSNTYLAPTTGTAGLKVGFATTVNVLTGGRIGGGGGGGGGGGTSYNNTSFATGGGGAGGGYGGTFYNGTTLYGGGLPGALNGAGGDGGLTGNNGATGGGGGRHSNFSLAPTVEGGICTGTTTIAAVGRGGQAGGSGASINYSSANAGGGGGGWGGSGGSGRRWTTTTGAGTFTVNGGNASAFGAGGNASETKGLTISTTAAGAAAGKGIDFNGFTVTLPGTGGGLIFGATS